MLKSPEPEKIRWGIYHRDREFAREMGDPCLAEVIAPEKAAAEEIASLAGLSGPSGIWAHPLPELKSPPTQISARNS
jgi:hypothetical protein